MKDIFLRSGKWRWSLAEESSLHGLTLELIDPAAPSNKMTVPIPTAFDDLADEQIAELAREPEIRLWTDEHDIQWRIARVGPETHYPYPLPSPHLVFDSDEAFAGIVGIEDHGRLGDLTDDELRRYRDRMRDFGGRRRSFRPPTEHHA